MGPEAALTLVDGLPLDGSHLFHAVRGDLLRRLGRMGEAAQAYEAALARAQNKAEQDFLQQGLRSLAENEGYAPSSCVRCGEQTQE